LALFISYVTTKNKIQIDPLAGTKESFANLYYLVGGVFISTFLLLMIFKFFKRSTRTLDLIITFIGFETLFTVFNIPNLGLALSILICITKYFAKESWLLKNFCMIMVTSTFATLIGYSIAFLPLFIFAVILAVYDYIAVYKTKHMVFLAENIIHTNYIFTIALINKGRNLEIGSGDFAIPITLFISAFFINYYLAFTILILSTCMLCLTIYLLLSKNRKVVPALPLQVLGAIIAYLCFIII
jgi:presenilin-like A22 family membrane protease